MPLTVPTELKVPVAEVERRIEYPEVALADDAVQDRDELMVVAEEQGLAAARALGAVRVAVLTVIGPPGTLLAKLA